MSPGLPPEIYAYGFMIILLTVPELSEVALLGPAAVLESDWDCDELPAASSLLDAWNKSCDVKTLRKASWLTFLH